MKIKKNNKNPVKIRGKENKWKVKKEEKDKKEEGEEMTDKKRI